MQCEVIVFTAGTQAYTDAVLESIDPHHEFIDRKLYRQHSSGHPSKINLLCKNLQLLGRNLDRCLLIDDIPDSYCLQPLNGWQIFPYGKRLIHDDIGSIIFKGNEEDFKRHCPPAILEGPSRQSLKFVVGCTKADFALLNAMYLVKELINSGLSVQRFTQIHEVSICVSLSYCRVNPQLCEHRVTVSFRKRCDRHY
eukprot:Blabericola_migrator_1__2391@NODE_1671_length_4044_cov_226_150616_g1085_i0_p2_GENE_NODE_1671_length_4044_cov_226_150616_g1085_i0NODE_1671_length_4044_cov_226_150616_g1085_i0_p2_ORF_typecomplete_len196_score13_80NIF/PF03031_18/4e18TAFH/PF07531_14/18TAFH/PF07531_14/33_NODE_1671_length_4044_cov_226_150616_g1085_i0153740